MPFVIFSGFIFEKIAAAAAAAAAAKQFWLNKLVSPIQWGKVSEFQEKNLSGLVVIYKKR